MKNAIYSIKLISLILMLIDCIFALFPRLFGSSDLDFLLPGFFLFLFVLTVFPMIEAVILKEKDINQFILSCILPITGIGLSVGVNDISALNFSLTILICNFICVCYCLATAKQFKTRRIH